MKRSLLLPLALLPGGCAVRHPATQPFWKGDNVPAVVHQTVPASEVMMTCWQLPLASPWARYSKMTLLASLGAGGERQAELPDVQRLPGLSLAQCAAERVAEAGLPPGTMWVVDLRGAESVAFGAALTQRSREPVSLVLTFNNWPASNELIPAEETLAGLVSTQPKLPVLGSEPSTPVFLLDSWRLAYRYVTPGPEFTDNRYMLTPADLPDADTLKAQGISRIVYLVGDRAEAGQEEDDLNATFLDYQDAGLPVAMVDLGWLCGPRPLDSWDMALIEFRFPILARATVRDDRDFYWRSHGGFGGAHAVSAYSSGIHGVAHGGG